MKMEITVTEAMELINEIRKQPDNLFEMIRADVKESVGLYMTELMDAELTDFLGRKRYERKAGKSNHRNGSYHRNYTLKGIGNVAVRIPRDRNGDFETRVIPRSKQYEDALREDLCVMFLSGVSTRTLSLISEKLIGRKICATEVSNASKQLSEAVEAWRQSEEEYMEVGTDTMTTDYQARRLNIRYKTLEGHKFARTVNDTGVAFGRAILSILENHQQEDGSVNIPEALQPYTGFKKILQKA